MGKLTFSMDLKSCGFLQPLRFGAQDIIYKEMISLSVESDVDVSYSQTWFSLGQTGA